MAKRVDLDAMIPREDFAVAQETYVLDLIKDFPITNLKDDSPVLKLLRKPDFQRETNHWNPDQVVSSLVSGEKLVPAGNLLCMKSLQQLESGTI